ncbi:MAG TPA: DNA internalization-related competence protein ComEC/Rec2 [Methylotenera sp.]
MILLALAFVSGAFCLQQMPVLPSLYWALALVPLRLIQIKLASANPLFLASLKRPLLIFSSFLFGFFWAAAFAAIRLSDELPAAWENKPIQIVGIVASVSELTERGERFRFDVETVLTEAAVSPQHISLSYYSPQAWGEPHVHSAQRLAQFKAGERWQFTVRLKRPHGTQNPHGFDFEAWALAENIRATGSIKAKADNKKLQNFVWRPAYMVEHVRELIQQRISLALAGKPYSGIIQALVMGDDSQIAVNDWQLFLRTGTSHLMSISGLHITMLSGLVFALVGFLWRRIPALVMRLPARKAATLAGMMAAVVYALIAGFAVPTQRTLYMLMVFALALWSGRQLVISQVLALALIVVVLFDPWAVISAGFWLSFGAVAMLSFALGARVGHAHWFKAALLTQWAVTIGMVPLLLIMFNQVSVVSPFANAIAIPLISFIVTPLALLGSFLSIEFALKLSHHALDVCMMLLNWFNQLPDIVWQQHASPLWTLLPATIGVLWLMLPRGVPMRWLGYLGLLPMLLIAPQRPNAGDMKVTVLDVGQGLSVVVQTATHNLLYDAGGKYSEQADAGARIVLPFLRGEGVSKLNGFIVSHNDTDHSGGMPTILAQMPVSWLASSLPESAEQHDNIKHVKCFSGQHWVWDGVDFQMIYPQSDSYNNAALTDNNRSCVLKITSASGSLLLTGDIERPAEVALIEQQQNNQAPISLKSDVMVAPHHGSKTSSSVQFISEVEPNLTIFTAGYLNRFRHPRAEIVKRYEDAQSKILRSDYHGAITLNFDALNSKAAFSAHSWRQQNRRYWHDFYE